MNRIKWIMTLSIIILMLARWSDASENVFRKNHLAEMILKYLTLTEYFHFIKTCHTLYDTHASEIPTRVLLHYQSLVISDNNDPIDPKKIINPRYLQRCVTYLKIPVTPIILLLTHDNPPTPIHFGNSLEDTIYDDVLRHIFCAYIGAEPELPVFTSVRLPVMLILEDEEFEWITERINEWVGMSMIFLKENNSEVNIIIQLKHGRNIAFYIDKSRNLVTIKLGLLNSLFYRREDQENVFQTKGGKIIYVFYYLPSIDYSNVLKTHK